MQSFKKILRPFGLTSSALGSYGSVLRRLYHGIHFGSMAKLDAFSTTSLNIRGPRSFHSHTSHSQVLSRFALASSSLTPQLSKNMGFHVPTRGLSGHVYSRSEPERNNSAENFHVGQTGESVIEAFAKSQEELQEALDDFSQCKEGDDAKQKKIKVYRCISKNIVGLYNVLKLILELIPSQSVAGEVETVLFNAESFLPKVTSGDPSAEPILLANKMCMTEPAMHARNNVQKVLQDARKLSPRLTHALHFCVTSAPYLVMGDIDNNEKAKFLERIRELSKSPESITAAEVVELALLTYSSLLRGHLEFHSFLVAGIYAQVMDEYKEGLRDNEYFAEAQRIASVSIALFHEIVAGQNSSLIWSSKATKVQELKFTFSEFGLHSAAVLSSLAAFQQSDVSEGFNFIGEVDMKLLNELSLNQAKYEKEHETKNTDWMKKLNSTYLIRPLLPFGNMGPYFSEVVSTKRVHVDADVWNAVLGLVESRLMFTTRTDNEHTISDLDEYNPEELVLLPVDDEKLPVAPTMFPTQYLLVHSLETIEGSFTRFMSLLNRASEEKIQILPEFAPIQHEHLFENFWTTAIPFPKLSERAPNSPTKGRLTEFETPIASVYVGNKKKKSRRFTQYKLDVESNPLGKKRMTEHRALEALFSGDGGRSKFLLTRYLTFCLQGSNWGGFALSVKGLYAWRRLGGLFERSSRKKQEFETKYGTSDLRKLLLSEDEAEKLSDDDESDDQFLDELNNITNMERDLLSNEEAKKEFHQSQTVSSKFSSAKKRSNELASSIDISQIDSKEALVSKMDEVFGHDAWDGILELTPEVVAKVQARDMLERKFEERLMGKAIEGDGLFFGTNLSINENHLRMGLEFMKRIAGSESPLKAYAIQTGLSEDIRISSFVEEALAYSVYRVAHAKLLDKSDNEKSIDPLCAAEFIIGAAEIMAMEGNMSAAKSLVIQAAVEGRITRTQAKAFSKRLFEEEFDL